MKLELQFFGGNGSGGGGESLGNGGSGNVNIVDETDVWSYRHKESNQPFVNAINDGIIAVQNEFPGVMDTVEEVNASRYGGADDLQTLGTYSRKSNGTGAVGINRRFTDVDKMNKVYDNSVSSGYHPGRGSKSGVEAVTIHEMGHAVTADIQRKMGAKNMDKAAEKIVKAAYKSSKGKGGTKAFAGKISGYAKDSWAECVAEAVADYVCNGSKASSSAKAIVTEMKKYY